MVKEIAYGGYDTELSDYECPDGSLSASLNLSPEEGHIETIKQPTGILKLPAGSVVMFIHKGNGYTHYILKIGDRLYWIDKDTASGELSEEDLKDNELTSPFVVTNANAIGNTLLVFGENNKGYYLWTNNTYKYIGEHFPELNLSFGLLGHARLYSVGNMGKEHTISFEKTDRPFTERKEEITTGAMGMLNSYLKEQTVDKERFGLPFLIRYAYRLYDGSLTMHSAPVLMNPITNGCPMISYNYDGKAPASEIDHIKCDVMLMAADITYKVLASSGDLSDWTDIISSVDIFVSKPIYTYDQDSQIKPETFLSEIKQHFIGRLFFKGKDYNYADDYLAEYTEYPNGLDFYSTWDYDDIYKMYFSRQRELPGSYMSPEIYDEKRIREDIEATNLFYHIKSFNLKEANLNYGVHEVMKIEEGTLQGLVAREVMTDDYLSHDKISAKFPLVYNQRLNLAGVKREMFRGFPMGSMLAYNETFYYTQISEDADIVGNRTMTILRKYRGLGREYNSVYAVEVHLKENSAEQVVRVDGSLDNYLRSFINIDDQPDQWGTYFFYPNVDAYKMVIIPKTPVGVDMYNKYEIELKAHPFLNGAYAFLGYNRKRAADDEPFAGSTFEKTAFMEVPNKLYTSEINNPFHFPVGGINTIGTGIILGISTAAKALSQGQFGQFPLYAFTDSGVWALSVASNGMYEAVQPITRDVCINAGSITQLDSSVLFATDRGIMLLSGSNSLCISDNLNAEYQFTPATLSKLSEILTSQGLDINDIECIPFSQFIRNCGIIYVYTKQHIILYNKDCSYAYVYNMKTKKWGMMESNIEEGVLSYPEALAMEHDGTLVSLSEQTGDALQGVKGVLITRPLKLDLPNDLKTVTSIVQRGQFRNGSIKSLLYASNDFYSWFLISTSTNHFLRGMHGTPYKYFRLALICDMQPDEYLYGCTVQYEPRMQNQLR